MQTLAWNPEAPATPVARDSDVVWFGDGPRPDEARVRRAAEVLSAVPLAGAIGWSVSGHPWSSHPRRLRTAIVAPGPSWRMESLRGVREVDCLTGPVLLNCRHVERLDLEGMPDWQAGGSVALLSRAMRRAGFRLLFMSERT